MVYRFCPKCAGKLKQEKTNLLVCQRCGFNWYQNPIPCNSAILENDRGEILLIKRKWPPHQGMWDLPGGFVDLGESLEESVQRELKEEMGVEIKDLKFFAASKQDRYMYQGVNYHTICFNFTGKIKNQPLKALDDVGEISFFPKDKIPFKDIAFKSLKKIIKDYISK